MVLLPLDTGLRLSEIAGLAKADIAPDVLRVVGKGRKTREVPLSRETEGACQMGGGFRVRQSHNLHDLPCRVGARHTR